LNKIKTQKTHYQPLLKFACAADTCHEKILIAEYNRGSSLVNLELYFKTLKYPFQVDHTLFKDWDSSHVEKRVLGKIGNMLGVMIEPVLKWGFVGHRLRDVAKKVSWFCAPTME
jgi:hypothetical protein